MKTNISQLLLAFVFGLVVASGVMVTNVYAGQPHMANALNDLRSAKQELQVAEHDKGGYREQAIGTIDQAIGQVKAGMAAGQ